MKRCPKCKAKLQKGRRRCPECGEFVARKKNLQNEKMKKYILGGAVALAVIALIVVVSLLVGGKKKSTLYMSATELSFVKGGSNKTVELTDELVYENSMDQFDLEYMANYYYSKLIKTSENGKIIFFPSNIIRLSNYTLSYRNVNETDGETVTVASKVSDYEISEDGTKVVYLSERELYLYDGDDSTSIGKNVTKFAISKNGEKIIFLDYERNLYSYQSGKEKKLAKDVTMLVQTSEDAEVIYYIKGTDLYKKETGKDAKKVIKNVSSIVAMYETGEIYYLKDNASAFVLSDYVEFDVKGEKDDLKKEIKEYKSDSRYQELCFFDGEKTKTVAEGVQQESIQAAVDRPVVFYTYSDFSKVKKIKLSDITNVWEAEEMIYNQVAEDKNYQVAVKAKATTIQQDNIAYTILAESGDAMYFVADVKDTSSTANVGNLYKVAISGSKAGKAKKYDKNVYARCVEFVGDTGVLYYKNVGDVNYTTQGDLYVNKKRVDDNVKFGSAICYGDVDDKTVYFLTDWRYQESMGTLKKVKGSKVVELRKSAHSFYSMEKGEVLFIADYDVETFSGNLYRHTGKKAKKIDKNVIAIMQNK